MTLVREVSLFRNGRNQALRVPRDFELPGDTAYMYQDGPRLIVESAPAQTFAGLFAGWGPLAETLPDIEDELMPLDEAVF
ncbi:MAG: hypothetical protein FWD63_04525 [Propionibacteriaceae bacterium]|nr:hypothetical protein [Propionibacteriaceae bacterium]